VLFQRQEYKNLIKGKTSRLNNKRVELLNSLGFAWELQRGGRRRRLTVTKGSHPGAEGTPPGHPAAKAEGPPTKKAKLEIRENFPIDDGTPVRRSATGRKRTTLKKKVTAADESSKCILPGVAIMGGGRDGPAPRANQQKHDDQAAQARTSPNSIHNGVNNTNGTRPPFQQQQMQMHPQQSFSNEALLRMLGANAGANPWQLLPNGAYQQMGNPFMGAQGPMVANPFYPMATGPFAMNPFVSSGFDPQRGMDPPQYTDGSNNGGTSGGVFSHGMGPQDMGMGRMQQQAVGFGGPGNNGNGPNQDSQNQRQPFYVPSGGGGQDQQEKQQGDGGNGTQYNLQQQMQMQAQAPVGTMPQQYGVPGGWNPGMSMGQQGQYWNDSNAAAAAAAAQHLQAAAALTAGMDERSLPPALAPLASVARHMNGMLGQQGMNGPGGNYGGPGGNYGVAGNPGPQNGGNGVNGMNMSQLNSNASLNNSNGLMNINSMPNNPNHMRGRRGDPPADPPTGTALSNMMMAASGGNHGRGVMKKMRMKQSIFEDGDEED
jgi:hypothetical protein